jgi:hypothetical protein
MVEMIRPTLERTPHFVGVFGAVVNTSNAAFVAADVIKHCFDDVGLYAKLCHSRCASPSEIMEHPGCNPDALIERRLCPAPILEA